MHTNSYNFGNNSDDSILSKRSCHWWISMLPNKTHVPGVDFVVQELLKMLYN